jgi:hypothetical protein
MREWLPHTSFLRVRVSAPGPGHDCSTVTARPFESVPAEDLRRNQPPGQPPPVNEIETVKCDRRAWLRQNSESSLHWQIAAAVTGHPSHDSTQSCPARRRQSAVTYSSVALSTQALPAAGSILLKNVPNRPSQHGNLARDFYSFN